jgi:hypothetical protein
MTTATPWSCSGLPLASSLATEPRIFFLIDKWIPNKLSVKESILVLFSYVRDSEISVVVALAHRRWARDISGGLSSQAIAQYLHLWDIAIETTLVNSEADKVIWKNVVDGAFSVKTVYNLFFMATIKFAWAKPICKSKGPMKCKFFMWLAVHRRCLTVDNIERREWSQNTICPLCQNNPKDGTHLFVHCRFSQ